MAGIIDKQIGPFTGGVWLAVIGGGAVLAFVIRRSMGSGGEKTKTEPLLAIETQTAPRVFGDVGQYGMERGNSGTPLENPGSVVKPPTVPPMQPSKPTIPVIVKPPGDNSSPGQGKPTPLPQLPGRERPLPLPTPTPTPQPKPTPTPAPGNVPGGFPTSCQGVIGFPSDYPGNAQQMLAKIKASNNPAQLSGKYIAWCVAGVGSAPIPTKLQPLAAYVRNRLNWPLINQIRRTRGLRALTSAEFANMAAMLDAQAKTGRDSFPDQFLASMWSAYYDPFICRNEPRRLGAKTV